MEEVKREIFNSTDSIERGNLDDSTDFYSDNEDSVNEFFDSENNLEIIEEDSKGTKIIIRSLQDEITQLRKVILTSQTRLMVLETAVAEEQRKHFKEKDTEKMTAQELSGSFKFYMKQMNELYQEIIQQEQERKEEWEKRVAELNYQIEEVKSMREDGDTDRKKSKSNNRLIIGITSLAFFASAYFIYQKHQQH